MSPFWFLILALLCFAWEPFRTWCNRPKAKKKNSYDDYRGEERRRKNFRAFIGSLFLALFLATVFLVNYLNPAEGKFDHWASGPLFITLIVFLVVGLGFFLSLIEG